MSHRAGAVTHFKHMGRALAFSLVAALVGSGAARGDVGIRELSPRAARPGDGITVVAAGFLGPRPWGAMPVVMIPSAQAPREVPCRGSFRSPIARRGDLRPPRYRIVGAVRNWRLRDDTGVNARGDLRFRLPPVRPGRYVFALFCDACWP